MNKIIVEFAHPALEKSRVNKRLVREIKKRENITFNDLYEEYFDFTIDVKREQELLLQHDIIVFHHPFYWYSTPALLKQWQDLVLEHGWAYGSKGTALVGKTLMNVITTGGSSEAYTSESFNGHTVRDFLLPIEQTARLCGMNYLPPFLIQGTHRLTEQEIIARSDEFGKALDFLSSQPLDSSHAHTYSSFNDFLKSQGETHHA